MRKAAPANNNQNTNNVNQTASVTNNGTSVPVSDWLWQLSVELSKSKLLKIIMLLALIATLFGFFPTRGDDYDVWWHLALGKYYIQHHTIKIDHSIFSWTPADKGWIYNTWLGSTILYLAYSLAGGFGLWLVQFGALLSVFLLFVLFVKLMGDSVDINYLLGFLLVGSILGLTAVYIKPELFSTLFFALTVFIYFYGKLFEKKKIYYVYPFFFILWVNVHGGFLAGLAFLSVALFGEAVSFFVLWAKGRGEAEGSIRKDILVTLFIAVALSYPAVLINPYGIDYHISVLKGLFSKEYMGFATQVMAYKTMWEFIFPKENLPRFVIAAWSILIMLFAFIGLSLNVYRKKKFFDLALIIINIVFFLFSMNSARYTIFFPIVTLYTIFYILKKADVLELKPKTTLVSIVLMVVLAGNVNFITVFFTDSAKWFGHGLEDFVPVREVSYIMKNKLQGPLYNDYLSGGYMMWKMYPDYKVFIDPRYGPFWKEVGPDYFRFSSEVNIETLHRFVQKYPFKTALLHMREAPLIFFMVNTGEWRLAYMDKAAVVLINKSLIPTLGKEALSTDMSPSRFRDVDSPPILQNLFNFYVGIGPQFGRQIREIYKKNVSDLYWYKEQVIATMDAAIARREEEIIQQREQQAQQAQQKAEVKQERQR
jgi:hypothetical protein